MRRPAVASLGLLLTVGLGPVSVASADEIVLKDGKTIATTKPYVTKGRQAILTRPDGVLVSIPIDEIDVEKTAAARSKPAPAPPKSPSYTPRKQLSTAEAAQIRSKRRATVVLTDEDVNHPGGLLSGGKAETGEGRIEVSSVTATRKAEGGITLVGVVANVGKSEVKGVQVTVEAVGDGNKTLMSTFANVAKDTLAPGEKSTFTAEFGGIEGAVSTYRYVPKWQVHIPVHASSEGSGSEPGSSGLESPTEPAAAPAAQAVPPSAAPAPENTPLPRPDYAAPPANAPVGAAKDSNSGYVPEPSGSQAKNPGD